MTSPANQTANSQQQTAASQHTEQGLASFAAGDIDGAFAHFNAAVALDSSCVKAWVNRGSVRNQRGDYAGAAEDFTRAIGLDPGLAGAYSNRGACRLALWEFSAAVADFDACLALDPRNCKAHLMRAYAWYHKRDSIASEADYRAAFALDSDYTSRFVVGQIVWSLRENAAAMFGDCEHHLRHNPGDFHSLARRGLARLLQGKDAEASPDFAEYRRLNPDSERFLSLLIDEAKRQRSEG